MQIRELELNQFRNLQTQHVSFSKNEGRAQTTIIIGRNGQGKTSLLEAIYVLAHGKSFRSSSLRELVQWGQADENTVRHSCIVSAEVETDDGSRDIQFKLDKGKKEISINGKRVVAAEDFYGRVCVVTFTPDDLHLISGGPKERRLYVDRVLAMVDKSYVAHLVGYQRAIKNRNKCLEDCRTVEQRKALRVWNELLIEHGAPVAEQRQAFVTTLKPLIRRYYQAFSVDSKLDNSKLSDTEPGSEQCDVRYKSHFVDDGAVISAEGLRTAYQEKESVDCRFKATTRGPHRDEIEILFDNGSGFRPARISTSQGQKRSLSLALKFAAVEYLTARKGEAPILLLDDVESELDASRRERLFQTISSLETQVVITSTELSKECREHVSEPQILSISQGVVSAQK